jgi:cell division protein FtsL
MVQENLEIRLSVHEATSAQRYSHIEERLEKGDRRMTRIEYLLYAVIVAVLLGPGVAATFFKKLFGM